MDSEYEPNFVFLEQWNVLRRNQMSSDEKETCSTEVGFNLVGILSSLHNLSHNHNSGIFAMLL